MLMCGCTTKYVQNFDRVFFFMIVLLLPSNNIVQAKQKYDYKRPIRSSSLSIIDMFLLFTKTATADVFPKFMCIPYTHNVTLHEQRIFIYLYTRFGNSPNIKSNGNCIVFPHTHTFKGRECSKPKSEPSSREKGLDRCN